MDIILLVLAGIIATVALLVAYGTWLIGRGSEAEAQAREMAGGSSVAASGWSVLDWLRDAPLPGVSELEDYRDHLIDVVASDGAADDDGGSDR